MKSKFLNLRILILFVTLLILLSNCGKSQKISPLPKAEKGILDLRNMNFEPGKGNIIRLDGEWEFYWNQLLSGDCLSSSQFSNNYNKITPETESTLPCLKPDFTGYINVPGSWKGFKTNRENEIIPVEGYATYRLKILFTRPPEMLAFKIQTMGTAYEFELNNIIIDKTGIIGKTREEMLPSFRPKIIHIYDRNTEWNITVRVSNFHHSAKSGIWKSILLADAKDIYEIWDKQTLTDWFTFGSLLLMGLYHLGFYSLRRSDKSPLWFGLFCILVAIRSICVGNQFLFHVLPESYFWIIYRLELISFYLGLPVIALFLHSIFPGEFSKKFLSLIVSAGLIFTLIVICTPVYFFTSTLRFYQIFTILISLYGTYVIILANFRKRQGARLFLAGFAVFFLTIVNDTLYSNLIIHTGDIVPLGLFVFTFSQAFLLSRRYADAFIQVQELSEKLELKVEERTQKLNRALNLIQKDLSYAKKIQANSLFLNPEDLQKLEIVPFYSAMSDVGGDFYSLNKLGESKYRIFLADVTGHGIQAALITIAVKGIWDYIKLFELPCYEILGIFNSEFIGLYGTLNSFLSCIIVDIDIKNNSLEYSSAGHPSCALISNGNLVLLKKTGKMIGIKNDITYIMNELKFEKEDQLYLFTDGIFEEFNSREEEFGEERFHNLLLSNYQLGFEKCIQNIITELNSFLGETEIHDDITILGIKIKN